MAIYGDDKPSFQLINALSAATHFNGREGDWIDDVDRKGQSLRCVLKTGTMVLFYEKTPDELYACSQDSLCERLYKVISFSSYLDKGKYPRADIDLLHHLEARPTSDIKKKKGQWRAGEERRPIIRLNHNQTKFLVEGVDFVLTVTGRIVFKK